MYLQYFYNAKLAHASYLVGCQRTGDALVVDPGRDISPYLATAVREGLRITGAAETHIHADFLSGARELAEQAGARLYLSACGGPEWQYGYPSAYDHQLLRDGDTFSVGNVRLEARHVPGHTPEHLAFLLTDSAVADEPMGIFTGDFLFVGSVGRPDLLEKAVGQADTAVAAARQMYASLQRIADCPDYLQVWPGHGAGSACGKGLGAVPSTTLGYERRFNPGYQQPSEGQFVEWLLDGQPEPPTYFAQMKRLNRDGPPLLDPSTAPLALDVEAIQAALVEGATVVDARPARAFAAGHLPGAINIPHDDSFINWAGWLIAYDEPFYVIAGGDHMADVQRDLASIGLDELAGYAPVAALDAWLRAHGGQTLGLTTPAEIATAVADGAVTLIDVRAASEWAEGHIPGARHIMLGYLPERLAEIDGDRPVVVQCASGLRSAIGASLVQAAGRPRVMNLLGGINRWRAEGLPVVNGL